MIGNWVKTGLLMAAITALFGVIGAAIGGQGGMILALLLGGGMNIFSYWFSDKLVLRMYGAREVDATSSLLSLQHGQESCRPCLPADAARLHHR
jgi:heat shock protein HtpX